MVLVAESDPSVADVLAEAGWELKPEGACQGEICVPLDAPDDLEAVAGRLGMALVRDGETVAVGPSSVGGRALETVAAPDIELPLALADGVWRLADQRGRRTVIVAWAPW
ncbi:MAG: hypothetical protein AAF480_03610 [Actinomycetota bacterium]